MQSLMKASVRNAHAPIFFFQAENDYDLSPSKVLSAVMKDARKPYEVKIYPPMGTPRKMATRSVTLDPPSGPTMSSDFSTSIVLRSSRSLVAKQRLIRMSRPCSPLRRLSRPIAAFIPCCEHPASPAHSSTKR